MKFGGLLRPGLVAEIRELPGDFLEVRYGQRFTRIKKWWVMLDDPVTLSLAGNKAAVHALLMEEGLPVPAHLTYTLDQIGRAWDFLRGQGTPCVVKPASDTGGGHGVTTGVETRWQLAQASAVAATLGHELLIERQIEGDNYRLLYLDGVLIDALRRGGPTVIGDGRSSIGELIRRENLERARGRRAVLGPITIDLDCRSTLRRAGLSLRSVPAADQTVRVKMAINEGSERDNQTVLGQIGASLAQQGARAAAIVGAQAGWRGRDNERPNFASRGLGGDHRGQYNARDKIPLHGLESRTAGGGGGPDHALPAGLGHVRRASGGLEYGGTVSTELDETTPLRYSGCAYPLRLRRDASNGCEQ